MQLLFAVVEQQLIYSYLLFIYGFMPLTNFVIAQSFGL